MTGGGSMRKKRLQATALIYRAEEEAAPRVVAQGKGKVAEKIIALAQEAAVPVKEDHVLANALSRLDLGEAIPLELFQAVAEILAAIINVDRQQPSGFC